jgi:hypothetical protein
MPPGVKRQPEVSVLERNLADTQLSIEQRLEQAIQRGAHHLLSLQADEGYWLGELEADTTLESEYIF